MTRISSYEEFRLLAEHPRHRNVPAIFLLEVIETDETEDNQPSPYPIYKVRTYSRAYATTLEEAESLMHQDILYRKRQKETDDWMQELSTLRHCPTGNGGLLIMPEQVSRSKSRQE